MWPALIVVQSPGFDLGGGILQFFKPVDVQTFIAEAAVEGFNGRVVRRLAAPTEVQNDTVRVRPEVRPDAHDFCAVVPSPHEAKASHMLL